MEPSSETQQPKATDCSALATFKHNKALRALNSSTDVSDSRHIHSSNKAVKSGWTPSQIVHIF